MGTDQSPLPHGCIRGAQSALRDTLWYVTWAPHRALGIPLLQGLGPEWQLRDGKIGGERSHLAARIQEWNPPEASSQATVLSPCPGLSSSLHLPLRLHLPL